MKRVIISVRGGVAEIHENDPNASIVIVDWDIENQHEMVKSKKENDIVIEVSGGVATCSHKPSDIQVDITDYDNLATCAFCGDTYPETEINMVDYEDDICTSCEKEHNDIRNYCENEQIAEAVEAQLKSEKLMYALLQFENYAREIKQICLEVDDETHSNFCDDYPFDKDFEEVAANISKWVRTQQRSIKQTLKR